MPRADLSPDALRADVARRLGRVLRGRPEAEIAALVEQVVRTELRWRGPMPLTHQRPERLFRPPLPVLHAPFAWPHDAQDWTLPEPLPVGWVEHRIPGVGTVCLPPWLGPVDAGDYWSVFVSGELHVWSGSVPTAGASKRVPGKAPENALDGAPAGGSRDAAVAGGPPPAEVWLEVGHTRQPWERRLLAVDVPVTITGWHVSVGGGLLRVTVEQLRAEPGDRSTPGPADYRVFGWWALEGGTWLEYHAFCGTRAGRDALLTALRTLRASDVVP